ncbi:MAG: hypothetical protein FJW30_19760 [Acidobacteria bacterium]|nr:hypothetical protein [Acidobacteriota bacterium]
MQIPRRGFLSVAAGAAGVRHEVETVESRHQATANFLRIARPKGSPARRTVLVLPVVAGVTAQWGDGFYEALALRWTERYKVAVAAPSFSALPWYADHPSDPKSRQELYLLEDILPRLSGRVLLLGFSKSGNGAMTLFLRHPDRFAAAASWDAPLFLDAPGKYGSGPIYGTSENFAGYAIPPLLERRAELLKKGPERLSITGFASFENDTRRAHEHMERLGIPHHYSNQTRRPHHWSSGWMEESMAALDRMTR